jgi:predicted RNA methylase
MISKKDLAVFLSMLKGFSTANRKLEQYTTDSEIAATALWEAYMQNKIKDKVIADLGCGTGILGIGCLLLGAKQVYFVEIDQFCVAALEKNLDHLKKSYDFDGTYKVLYRDVGGFFDKVDLVIQNPPFGTKETHADKKFLEKAFEITDTIFTFHKTSTRKFVEAITKDNKFMIKHFWDFAYPLKKTMKHHTKERLIIEVTCFWLEKK